MKDKKRPLTRITAFFLILFILGGYFSMVSRFLGEKPNVISETLFFIGIFGSFISGVLLSLSLLFKKEKTDEQDS